MNNLGALPVTTNAPDMHGVYEKLGEMSATLREVAHTGRNNSQKIDALAEVVIKQGLIHEKVSGHSIELGHHDARLLILELDKHHRDGAVGLVAWVSSHWPFTVFAGVFAIFVAWANGKLGF